MEINLLCLLGIHKPIYDNDKDMFRHPYVWQRRFCKRCKMTLKKDRHTEKRLLVLLFIMFGVCLAIYTNLIMVCIADYTPPNYSLFRQERLVNLGEFELTAYCPCEICTGKSIGDIGYQVTASGMIAFEGYTIATDTSILPFNSKVSLGKYGSNFIAQDTGSAIKGNRIDIYFNNHQDALNFGRQSVIVYWILEKGEN